LLTCIAGAKSDKTAPTTSKAYVLVSTLPDKYRTAEILSPSRAPTTEQESHYIGLYSFVVSLIYLSGGTLSETKLDRYLKRMNADTDTPIGSTEKVLQRMIKDGYIVKVKDNSTGEELIDYHVGPRGKVEVGTEGAAQLAKMVWGEAEQDDLTARLERTFALQIRQDEAPPATQSKPRGRPKKRKSGEMDGEEEPVVNGARAEESEDDDET
jgi:melanoma-associated antigen